MSAGRVVVIGGGPGGYVAALRAAERGLAVTLVEKEPRVGGVCTLRGCIPTKAWLHVAEVLEAAREGLTLGVKTSGVELDLGRALAFQDDVVGQNVRGIGSLLTRAKVEVVHGAARLEGPGRVVVGERVLDAAELIVATGSSPKPLPGLPFDGVRVLSSDDALRVTSLPESMLILGAGAVGVEFASIFSRFGVKVTLIEAQPRLLPIEDEEVSAELGRCLRRRGITVMTGTKVTKAVRGDDAVTLEVESGGVVSTVSAPQLLVAIGRSPNSGGFGLDSLGVQTERGFITVDAHMRTSAKNVWAIGDVVPTPQLAHVAMKEAQVAVDDLAGARVRPLNYRHVPSCTYSAPEVASVGLTEAAARASGLQVRTGKFPFKASGKARAIAHTEGFTKLVVDAAHDEVVGVHLIGPRVTELLAEATLGLALETTSQELAAGWHAHPTLSEALGEAAEAVLHGHALHA